MRLKYNTIDIKNSLMRRYPQDKKFIKSKFAEFDRIVDTLNERLDFTYEQIDLSFENKPLEEGCFEGESGELIKYADHLVKQYQKDFDSFYDQMIEDLEERNSWT